MTPVSFDKICRYCLTTNGAKSIYMVKGDIGKIMKQTEYEFANNLEKWLRNDKSSCEFCGSPFVEGINIEIDNHKLYDFNTISKYSAQTDGQFFIWTIMKTGSTIQLNVGGRSGHDPIFISECFALLYQIIDNWPENKLIYNAEFGDLMISLTGQYNGMSGSFSPVIQRFRTSGLTKDDIIRCIKSQIQNFGHREIVDPTNYR